MYLPNKNNISKLLIFYVWDNTQSDQSTSENLR